MDIVTSLDLTTIIIIMDIAMRAMIMDTIIIVIMDTKSTMPKKN